MPTFRPTPFTAHSLANALEQETATSVCVKPLRGEVCFVFLQHWSHPHLDSPPGRSASCFEVAPERRVELGHPWVPALR